ncbi:hypothetical protein Q9L42_005645 [Methylomarinum sp. Ch1-1]|uniref:Lipoprotein n=1 Tax=Methylomarinum roseum TaxID=3067653 RepID=A0AAU7NYG4_9GAMM|nr:hypothetical protein [Methylomarinum sp. Ch1-1]MDP4522313.1 hypothetical protein [Methylomarinum sp. Ch1-1]
MRIITRGLLLVLVALSLVSCKKVLKPNELPAHIAVGDTYYTQFVIRYEKGTHVTTNYRRGASIPVNTPVNLLKITTKTIEVALDDSNQKLLVKNVEKHTGDDVIAAFDKLFAKNKVNLSKFTRLERQHIKSGTAAKGMRKEAVIVAIGYPPVTETMSLDSDTWVYWSGRFNRFNVHFKNGKVSWVED